MFYFLYLALGFVIGMAIGGAIVFIIFDRQDNKQLKAKERS